MPGNLPVWDAAAIDALTETVVTRLLVDGAPARRVAVELAGVLAAERPGLPGLALALPFTLAASAIEDMLGGGLQARAAALDAWRIAALIGADALALRMAGPGKDSVADLRARWLAGDEVFGV